MPFNLRQWCEFYPAAATATFFTRLQSAEAPVAPAATKGLSNASRDILSSTDATERSHLVESYLQEQLAKVLRCSVSKLGLQQPINRLGLDSLMAVELRNRIQSDLGISLPVVNFIKGPSITQLSIELLEQLPAPVIAGAGRQTAAPIDVIEDSALRAIVSDQAAQMDQEDLNAMLAELGQLSNDEAWAMFSDRQM